MQTPDPDRREYIDTLRHEIAALRADRGLTLRALSDLVNEKTGLKTDFQLISNVANGRDQKRTRRPLVAMAEILDPTNPMTPYRWCALAGVIHPALAAELLDPDFAAIAAQLMLKANRR